MENSTIFAPLLYDPVTAARLLSVSRATLYKLIDPDPATGLAQLPSVKVGRSRRITRDALLAFVGALGA